MLGMVQLGNIGVKSKYRVAMPGPVNGERVAFQAEFANQDVEAPSHGPDRPRG